jgi:(p)ppGpp synthase/HD superfamily hydrolase
MLGDRFDRALVYASHVHGGQVRKGTTAIPYLSHLLMVAGLVLEYGGDEDEAIAALLHDAVEDQGGLARRLDIDCRFGPRVAAIVDGCTDAVGSPKPAWRARKEAYLRHLDTVSASARLVSAADKLANVRSIIKDYRAFRSDVWGRFNGGREGTLWYYRALADAYTRLGPPPLAAALSAAIRELEALLALDDAASPEGLS